MTTVVSADWVLPVTGPPIPDGAVVYEDGRIVAVGPASALGRGTYHEDAVLLPGLVNCHSHLEYAVYTGFGDGVTDFSDWIGIHVARKRRIGFEEMADIARLGAAECLRSGITTVGDCSYGGAAAAACADLGLRAVVYLEVFGADPDAALASFERLRGVAAGSLSDSVQLGVSPHAPYSVSGEVYEACASLGLPLATHLAESSSELEYLRDGSGPWQTYRALFVEPAGTTGVRLLAARGLLGPALSAAHCVTVDAEEIALLASSGTGICHCPRSNGILGCGIAPLRQLLEAGATVGLGTDSPASTPPLDMFEEMRTALAFARARERTPAALTPAGVLELATIGSARVLGLDREVGSLEPGKRADLTIVSLAGSPLVPIEDPAAAVVYGGSPDRVVTTVVGGEVRYVRGGIDWRVVQQRARAARARLLGASP